jgi:hypothetical protein
MGAGTDAADLLVDHIGRGRPGRIQLPPGSAVEALYLLVDARPEVSAHLWALVREPHRTEVLVAFREALRLAAEDPSFDARLAPAVLRVRDEATSRINQHAHAEGTGNTINQAGRDVIGDNSHVGDVHFHQTRKGKLIIGGAVLLVIALVAVALSSLPDKQQATAQTDDISRTTTTTTTTTIATKSSAPPAPSGSLLYPGTPFTVVSNGHVVAHSDHTTTGDTTVSTRDLVTGEVVGGFTLKSHLQPGLALHEPCRYSLVRVDGKDLVLSFEAEFTGRQGTVSATMKRRLVARDARTGARAWSTPDHVSQVQDSGATKSWAGCDGEVPERSLAPDGRHAWIHFTSTAEPVAVDLGTGATRAQPGSRLVGGYVVNEAQPGAAVTLVDLGSGAVVASTTDNGLTYSIKNSARISPDNRVLVYPIQGTSGHGALALPGLTPLWTAESGPPVVLVTDKTVVGAEGSTVTAESSATGALLWTNQAIEEVCGVSSGTLVVLAGGQVALLDESTGTQKALFPDATDCPKVLPGVMVHQGTIVKL